MPMLASQPVEWSHPLNIGLSHWLLAHPRTISGASWWNLCAPNAATANAGYSSGLFGVQAAPRTNGFSRQFIFDGTNDATVAGAYAACLGKSRVTMAAWAYLYAANYGWVIGFGGSGQRFGIQANNSNWYAITYTGSGESYQGGYGVSGVWTHVCFVYDGTQATAGNRIAMYLNATRQASSLSGTPPTTVQTPSTLTYFSLGKLGTYTAFNPCAIDDFRLWPGRALSDTDVGSLYRESLAGNPTTLRRARGKSWLYVAAGGGTTYTASASIAGVGAVSATALREQFPAATIPGTGAVAATALREQFPAATVAGVGALSATADRTAVVVASIAGAGSLSAAAVREAVVSATIAAAGSLSATFAGVNTQYAAATIAGVSDVQATAARSTFATATIGGVGTLSATLNSEILCAVSIAGTGTVTATAIRGQFAAAIVSAVSSVVATATATGDLGGPVRDYHLLADAVERLKATGLFDDVYLASPGEYAGVSTFTQLAFVYQTGFAWDDMGTTGDEADVYRTVEYRVAIIARDTDPTRRYARLDQAGAAASNALSGVRLADATMPVDTRLRLGRYVAFPPPLAGLELRGEARRIVAGYDANDVTDDIDDLDP